MIKNSYDMEEELFVAMMARKSFVPLDEKRIAEERRYYQMTPSADGKFSAVSELLNLYIDSGFFDEGITVCSEALENPLLKEHETTLYFWMGQISERKKDFDAALKFYLKSLDVGAAHPEFQYWQHNNVAFCYLMKQDFEQAEAHCRIALDLDDQNWKRSRFWSDRHWNAWKNMGMAMECTGRYKEAASFYTTAIKLSPRCERAILHLRRLLTRHPDLAIAWKESVEDLATYYKVTI